MMVISSIFSCCPLQDTEAMFLFFLFQIYVVSIHFSYRIVLLFLRLFQQFYFLNWLISCWYLSSAAMLVFELFLDRIFPYLSVRIVRLSERSFSWAFIGFIIAGVGFAYS